MIRFNNDYNHAAHESIYEAMKADQANNYPGYGADEWCTKAAEEIKKLIVREDPAIYFFPGATQANFVVCAAALNSIQSVVCPKTGHINCHEAGSIENTGHKIIELPSTEGKITAQQVRECASSYFEHGEAEYLTEPKLVYISFPTEYGTIYSLKELQELHRVCKEYGMYLFVDGARMGYGLGASVNDVTLKDLAELTDVFYIGGTKCGAMFGEAVILVNEELKRHFKTYMKQNGAVLAKGWLLGLQFYTLLKDGTYFTITKRADEQAMRIKEAFHKKEIPEYMGSYTNQQFVILSKEQEEKLSQKYIFELDGVLPDGRSVVRFCTSWSTTDEEVDELVRDILAL